MSEKMKLSRLELRLEAEISAAPSVLEADCKRAELAAYWVRLGRVAEVELALQDLHHRYRSYPNVAISAWLNLVEGLAGHFGDMDPGARDKVLRSHALSSAAGLLPMQALAAAWLAHFDYTRLDAEATAVHVRLSFSFSLLSDDSIRSRANLVVAQILHLAGRYDVAKSWYLRARFHANRDGDDATIGAILHNMAWLHMSNFRQIYFANEFIPIQNLDILMSAESAKNFDHHFNVNTLMTMEPILRAQIFSLRGQWLEALELYEKYFTSTSIKGASRFLTISSVDQVWCRLNLGEKLRIQEDTLTAIQHIDENVQIDEFAAIHSRVVQIFEGIGNSGGAGHHREVAKNSWMVFSNLQERIIDLFGGAQ